MIVDALDGGRRWVWRQVVRTPVGRTCARDRSARVLALGLGHVAVTLVLVALGPAYLLILGPIVLGVPHVIADVRHLVVRGPRSLQPVTVVALSVPLAIMVGLRVVEGLGGPFSVLLEVALGFAAIAIAIVLARGRHAWVAIAATALAVPALLAPNAALMVLLHGHNLVGLAIWLGFTRRTVRPAHQLAVIAAIAAGTLVIFSGVLDGHDATITAFGSVLAPGVTGVLAYRIVLAYVFLQAMHYVVWLRLIPITQAPAPAASTFRRSVDALTGDFGTLGLGVLAIAALAVPIAAGIYDPERVRDVYLGAAVFHAWLELALIAYLLVGRERLR